MTEDSPAGDFNARQEFDKAIFNQDADRLKELIADLKLPKDQRADFLTAELRKACALVYHGEVDVEIVDALIDAGAKMTKPQGHDVSPFGIICQSNDVSLLRHMIDRGADVNADVNIDQFGAAKPLHVACGHSQNPEVVAELLNHKANPNAKGFFGQTPLHMAATSRVKRFKDGTGDRAPIVDLLVKHGAKIDAVDKWEQTPLLSLIAHAPDAKLAEKLIDHGANLKHTSKTDGSALHLAAERGLYEIVDVLIRKGAPLLLKNAQGRTPHEHAREHHEAMKNAAPPSASAAMNRAADSQAPAPSNDNSVNYLKVLQSLEEAEKQVQRRNVRKFVKHKWGL